MGVRREVDLDTASRQWGMAIEVMEPENAADVRNRSRQLPGTIVIKDSHISTHTIAIHDSLGFAHASVPQIDQRYRRAL